MLNDLVLQFGGVPEGDCPSDSGAGWHGRESAVFPVTLTFVGSAMDVTVVKVTATTLRELISGLSRFARSSTPIGLTPFLLDFLQYAAAIAGVLLLPALCLHRASGRAAVSDPAPSVT